MKILADFKIIKIPDSDYIVAIKISKTSDYFCDVLIFQERLGEEFSLEDNVELHGFIKFDHCSDWSSDNIHLCNAADFDQLSKAIKIAYEEAAKLIPSWISY